MKARRRFHFDNYFKRVAQAPPAEALTAGAEEQARGFVVFTRDCMKDVLYYDRPAPEERAGKLAASAFAGEYAP